MKFIEDNNKSILGDFSWDKKYPYKKYERATTDKGQRTYDVEGKKIPSVTTILSSTKPKEAQESLQKWRDRVGAEEARKITQAAAIQFLTFSPKVLLDICNLFCSAFII
jgi:hypothetical protein